MIFYYRFQANFYSKRKRQLKLLEQEELQREINCRLEQVRVSSRKFYLKLLLRKSGFAGKWPSSGKTSGESIAG